MSAAHDLNRMASSAAVVAMVAVMLGAGAFTLVSRTAWWCEQRAEAEVEALRAVARTHFPEAALEPETHVACGDDGVRATVRTDLPGLETAAVTLRLQRAGWTDVGSGTRPVLRSPDGRWQATVAQADQHVQVRLATLDD